MPIEMPRGLPFSVDTWNPTSKMKRHHFLTHAHKDHCSGITSYCSYPIYSTLITKSLMLRYFPQLDESLFVGIEVGQSIQIDDPDGCFTVTAFDANHCKGAVMFLFEGDFGNILHTGDCRLTPECLQNMSEKYLARNGKEPSCSLDFVFLDCTFGKSLMKIPSRQSAIQQLINCIWRHPDTQMVYLTCDFLGQEEILLHIFQTFGSKIYVDKSDHPDFYKVLQLITPQILSEDPSTRFHLFEGFPKLYEKARRKLSEARENMHPEPLIIRPSAQWYAREETELTVMERKILEKSNIPVKDQFGVWHVCYSMHSSRQELEWALQLLAPKWVVSTTPECRALELDYIKKRRFTNQASDDRFWKILDINVKDSSKVNDLSVENNICSSLEETTDVIVDESELQLTQVLAHNRDVLNLSPMYKKPPVTLFGRARLGYQSCMSTKGMKTEYVKPDQTKSNIPSGSHLEVGFEEGEKIESVKDSPKHVVTNEIVQKVTPFDDNVEHQVDNPTDSMMKVDATEIRSEDLTDAVVSESVSHSSTVSSSKGYNDNLRKLYRSMNAPVPQPLPSLVELMKANKRAKSYEVEKLSFCQAAIKFLKHLWNIE